ncbi:MAG: hypothetical protein IKC63_00390 [Clostridia bacterium]|nr:hypothetical protein [Clostridia bacterium]
MKKSRIRFRYDDNCAVFGVTAAVFLLCLILAALLYRYPIALILFNLMAGLSLLSACLVRRHGITLSEKEKTITVVDDLGTRRLKTQDVLYAVLQPIEKETKSTVYGFFHEFFEPYTYMSGCDYVYRSGRVYRICLYMKDKTVIESYYGWLYRAGAKRVERTEARLKTFIGDLNARLRESRNK